MNEQLLENLKIMEKSLQELNLVRAEFVKAEREIRTEIREKHEIDFSGTKGKAKGIGIAVAIYVIVLLLLATAVCHLWVDWLIILVGAAVCFSLWNSKKGIAIISGLLAVAGFVYLIKAFVVDTLIRAVKVGNYTALIILMVLTALLFVAIILLNRLYVKKANESIRVQNIDIRAMNEILYNRIDNLDSKEKEILNRIGPMLNSKGGFYPDAYAFEEAATFFVNKLVDFQKEYSMEKLIDMWEKEQDREYQRRRDEEERLHRIFIANSLNDVKNYLNQITDNQEIMQRQLHFNNIMNLYNICQLSAIRDNSVVVRVYR